MPSRLVAGVGALATALGASAIGTESLEPGQQWSVPSLVASPLDHHVWVAGLSSDTECGEAVLLQFLMGSHPVDGWVSRESFSAEHPEFHSRQPVPAPSKLLPANRVPTCPAPALSEVVDHFITLRACCHQHPRAASQRGVAVRPGTARCQSVLAYLRGRAQVPVHAALGR